MIGRLVDDVIKAGFDIYVHQNERMIILQISKSVGKEICSIDWAMSYENLAQMPDWFLLDGASQRLLLLRDMITKKQAEIAGDESLW